MGFVSLLKKETIIPSILWSPVYPEIFPKTPYLFLDIHYKPNRITNIRNETPHNFCDCK